MIFETLDRIGPFVVVCSQSASIPAKKRRVLVRCANCNATQEMLASSLSDKRLFEQSVCSRCRPRNGNPHTWATRAKFEELKMTMENDLSQAQAAVRETLAQLRTVLEERDSYRRQLDAIGDAIVPALVQRIEPRLSRHPVTVIMAAGALIAKIGEAIGCEFEDGDDLLEAVKGLVRERDEARDELVQMQNARAHVRGCLDQALEERDEARAEVREYREQLRNLPDANRIASQDAYRRGAEAMREACATRAWDKIWDAGNRTVSLRKDFLAQAVRDALRALPIPEET